MKHKNLYTQGFKESQITFLLWYVLFCFFLIWPIKAFVGRGLCSEQCLVVMCENRGPLVYLR